MAFAWLFRLAGGATASYVCNALGQRVEKRVGSTYTEYVWGAYGELDGLHDRTNWVAHFIPVGGRVLAMYTDGTEHDKAAVEMLATKRHFTPVAGADPSGLRFVTALAPSARRAVLCASQRFR